MSIIYSYPTTQPTVDDLLIGTDVGDDNATKSFTVQSLVSLINAQSGSGTLTGVTISTDAFLTAVGNPTGPAVAYTIGLAATGTPSATTFLRGDNQWVIPTVSAGIGVTSNNNPITSDVSNFNFTGAGVVTSLSSQGNVNINIEGAINAVESIIASTGISVSSETGNVIVTNTGITSLVEGGGITIATNSTGQATLTVATQSGGTVTSVGAGDGLVITNSDAASPIIALDYTGADTYITQPVAAVPLAADLIPFHSVSGNTVSKVTFGDIQASTLALVNTSITTANADAITNTYDKSQQAASPNNRTVGAVPATQIVTCSAAEYTAMDSAGELVDSFIYLTTASAAPQNTVNFTINSGTISASGGCSVTTSTTVNNNAVLTITGAVGSSYTVRTTITASGSGCVFSGTNPQILTGTIPAGSTAAVTQNLTGSVSVPAGPSPVSDTLQSISTSNISGSASGYTVSSNSPISGNGPFNTSLFGLTATANTGYEFNGGAPTLAGVYNQSTSTYGSNTTTGSFPAGSAISLITYNVSYNVSTSNITNNTGNSFNYVISGGTFSGSAQSGGPIAVPSGSSVTVTARIVPTGTDIITPNPTEATVTVASVTSDQTITVSPTGTISSGTSSMTLNPTTSFTPAAAWPSLGDGNWGYSIDGAARVAGLTATGTTGLTVNWTFLPNPPSTNSGYTSTGTTINSASGVLGTNATVSASATGTAAAARYPVYIAATGGQSNPSQPNYACNQTSIGYQAWTVADRSVTGIQFGDLVYASSTGSTPYNTNTLTWWKCYTSSGSGTQIVNFDSSGVVQGVNPC
jgi:hypothetical protein